MPLSPIAKRVIPADYQALVEAGYLTNDLQTTEAGRLALMQLTFVEFEAEIVAKAKAKIEEDKAAEAKKSA